MGGRYILWDYLLLAVPVDAGAAFLFLNKASYRVDARNVHPYEFFIFSRIKCLDVEIYIRVVNLYKGVFI